MKYQLNAEISTDERAWCPGCIKYATWSAWQGRTADDQPTQETEK